MAASSNLHLHHHHKTNISSQPPPPPPAAATFDPAMSLPIPNTTFVQADPSNFRAVVQKLTGAPPPPPQQDSLLSLPKPTRLAGKLNPGEMGPRRPVFKLHERRLQTARKLEIKLNDGSTVVDGGGSVGLSSLPSSSSSAPSGGCWGNNNKVRNFSGGFGGEMVMVSPVSPLELMLGVGGGSPRTPKSPMEDEYEEERKAIAEKGFYLHPSPLSTPRGSEPPELLPLFPLHSPKTTTTDHHPSSSSSF